MNDEIRELIENARKGMQVDLTKCAEVHIAIIRLMHDNKFTPAEEDHLILLMQEFKRFKQTQSQIRSMLDQ